MGGALFLKLLEAVIMRHLTAEAAANIPFGSPSQADLLVYLPTPERRSPELSAFLSQASFGWGSLLDVNRETTVTNDGYLSEHALKGVWYAWREASGRLHRVYRDLKRDPDCLNTRLAPSLAGMKTTPPRRRHTSSGSRAGRGGLRPAGR